MLYNLPEVFGVTQSKCLQDIFGSQFNEAGHFGQVLVNLPRNSSQMEDLVLQSLGQKQIPVIINRTGMIGVTPMFKNIDIFITFGDSTMDILQSFVEWKSFFTIWNPLARVYVFITELTYLQDVIKMCEQEGISKVCFVIYDKSSIRLTSSIFKYEIIFTKNCTIDSTKTLSTEMKQEPNQLPKENQLRVSVMQWKPFSKFDENRRDFTGIEIDLLKTIGYRLNINLTFQTIDFERDNHTLINEHLQKS